VQEDQRRTLKLAADATVIGAELGDIALVEVVAIARRDSSHRLTSRTGSITGYAIVKPSRVRAPAAAEPRPLPCCAAILILVPAREIGRHPPGAPSGISTHITDREIDALHARVVALLDNPVMPTPDRRQPKPWPAF
jgi:hypothetical protein